MPHLTLEYSANLEARLDMPGLCDALHAAILETGLFEVGAVRVRAFAAAAWAVADRLPQNGFIDMRFRMGAGRSLDDRKRTGDAIFSAASAFTAPLLAGAHFALSLEVQEINPALSWKKNAIHPRLRRI
jgi:5-carboxymethyl-2-hydroxymuconate isomerase